MSKSNESIWLEYTSETPPQAIMKGFESEEDECVATLLHGIPDEGGSATKHNFEMLVRMAFQGGLVSAKRERDEDKKYIEELCADLCKMEDALGFKNDCHDKDGAFIPTIGPWLERVRDLIAAEGELGDLKAKCAKLEAAAVEMLEATASDYKRWQTYHGLESGEQRIFKAIERLQAALKKS